MNVIISKVKGAEAITFFFNNAINCSDYALKATIIMYYKYKNYIILIHGYSFRKF